MHFAAPRTSTEKHPESPPEIEIQKIVRKPIKILTDIDINSGSPSEELQVQKLILQVLLKNCRYRN